MTTITIPKRRASALRAFAFGLAAGSLIVWSGLAQGAPPPESFSGLAKKVTPAVVNIAAVHEASGAKVGMPDPPFNFPEGSPFEEFFKQFRDRMGKQGRGNAQPRRATGLGSGFIIDPSGYVVTNNHVVDGASDVQVRLDDDSVYPARLMGTDPQTDLALLKIDANRPLPAVAFGNSDKAEVGDWVMAVGNPFGLGGTVTAGIISARSRNIDAGPYDDFLQIDAPINQGNSGGPLFDMDGNVIGVNTAIFSPNGGSVGIGFAIPSDIAKTVIAQIKENGRVERGWLGVYVQKVTPEIASALGLKGADGAMVTEVTPDSPAQKTGLKKGDVILAFAGEKIGGPRELALAVAKEPAGREVNLTVWRERREKTLEVVTSRQPVQAEMAATRSATEPDGSYHSSALNADLAALTPERRAEFGIADDVSGVLVLDLQAVPVFGQGLRAGDVIREVAQTTVTSPQEIDALVRKARSGSENVALMLVRRQGHDLFVGVKLGIA